MRVLTGTGWDVCGLDAVLVHYRMSAGGLSADLARMDDGWRAMMARARQYAPEAMAAAEGPAHAMFERYLARRALRTGQNPAKAFAHLRAAFRHSPRAMLTRQPKRTFLTMAGAVGAALLPAAMTRGLLG